MKRINWWRLKEPEARSRFKEKVQERWINADGVQEWWTANSKVLRRAGEEALGKTSGKKAPADKEAWWWNEEVQQIVKRKKILKKKWDTSGSEEDKEQYKAAKKEAKRAVTRPRNQAWEEVYRELETPEGEKKFFKLAKKRNKASKKT